MKFSRLLKSENVRSQLIKRNIVAGIVIKGVSIVSSLLLVPLTIGYISSELYGIWLTLSSIIHWISFFDIGFGNGLRNKLSESLAIGNYTNGKIYTSTTYFIITAIFIPIAITACICSEFINWAELLNVSRNYNAVLIKVAQILFITFSVQMILKLIQSVALAYQLNALSTLMDCFVNVCCLVSIYVLSLIVNPNLEIIAIVFSLSPLVVLFVFSLVLYRGKFKKVAPSIHSIYVRCSSDIFSLGSSFFIIQVAALVLYQMINIIISRLCGPEYVTQYNIAYKYITTAMIVVTIIVAPIWSAFTDAYVKNDITWMKAIYGKLTKMFFVACIGICILIAISPVVYDIWIGDKVYIPFATTLLIGIYTIIGIYAQINSSILNGIGKIRFQLIYSIVIMVVFIPISYLLGRIWGVNGILIAMIVVNAPGIYFGRYQVLHLINKTAKGIWNR